jgi:16S rRNA (cytosine1402-N4)-methyltransferase
MDFEHVPVLFDEVMEALNIRPGGIYVDGTVGGGGHSAGICERLGDSGTLIAVDRDCEALAAAEKRLAGYRCGKRFVHANYSDVEAIAEAAGKKVQGILLDLGVSSYQLDNPERGFSYMKDAPLDMRMDDSDRLTAYDIVNGYSGDELTRMIREYGEERWASRIAEFIVRERAESPIDSTGRLTEIIKAAIPAKARRTGPHPAKRTFQAIRIELNRELEVLRDSLDTMIDLLNDHGRICVITFHSLEDRIVKNVFKTLKNPCICPPGSPICVCGRKQEVEIITNRPLVAGSDELAANPRSRSAKLRAAMRVEG